MNRAGVLHSAARIKKLGMTIFVTPSANICKWSNPVRAVKFNGDKKKLVLNRNFNKLKNNS
jgi:hypothetical protein